MGNTICHLTSVHSRYDTRIFLKQCRSLVDGGYEVFLVVADGKGDEEKDAVHIIDIGLIGGRLERIFRAGKRILKKAVFIDADIYHLHDPELIPVGLRLRRRGKIVIFDSHEDVPRQMLGKPYWNKSLRWAVSIFLSRYEKWACKKVDAIVAATPFIRDKFLLINPISVDINNYPLLGEFSGNVGENIKKNPCVCYVGAIGSIRGIREMVKAMEYVESDALLQIGGKFVELDVEREVKQYAGWKKVEDLGWLDRDNVRLVLQEAIAGLVTLHPIVNYIDALPVKMFEYMSAGVPVIASNIPLWVHIVEGNECGICVDPFQPKEIAFAIDKMVKDPELSAQMGRNGRKAVEKKYNWENEEKKLLNLYEKLLI